MNHTPSQEPKLSVEDREEIIQVTSDLLRKFLDASPEDQQRIIQALEDVKTALENETHVHLTERKNPHGTQDSSHQ